MISPVARTYAWLVILGRTGIVNVALTGLGLSDEPIRFLFSETAIFIGLIQLFFPLMVLPLVSALENLPADVVPAARVLGASWWTVFRRILLPLTREGLVVGGTLVFVGPLTVYVTPGDPRRPQGADAGDADVPARLGRQRLCRRRGDRGDPDRHEHS